MVYMGQEQPVAMPSMGVYDTDLVKAYIAGIKQQYDDALNKLDKFYEKYGDFYSPISGDTDYYYNATIGGAKELIDNMYAQGADPFKNPQARAMINKYIYSRPVGELNQIKQNAENMKLYNQNLAALQAKGLYNKEMEDMRLKELGLDNFKTIDNGRINVWNQLSPVEYKSLFDLTNDEFKKFAPIEYLRPSTRWGFDVYGVKDENAEKATSAATKSALSTIQGRYYYSKAEEAAKSIALQNNYPTDEKSIKDLTDKIFEQSVRNEQVSYLQETEKENAITLAKWKQKQENIGGIKNPGESIPNISFTTAASAESNKKLNKAHIRSIGFIANVFENLANNLKDGHYINVGGKSMTSREFRSMSNFYKKHGDLSKQENVQAFYDKGLIDENGNFTKKFTDRYAFATTATNATMNVDSKGQVSFSRNFKQSEDYYENFAQQFNGGALQSGGMKILTGTDGPVEVQSNGMVGKQWVMNLEQGGWNISSVRKSQVGGYRGQYNLRKLQEFLKQNSVKAYSNSVSSLKSYAAIPTADGNYNMDFTGDMYIKMSDIESFLNKMGYTSDNRKMNFCNKLGLTVTYMQDNGIFTEYKFKQDPTNPSSNDTSTTNKKLPVDTLYVRLSITKTIENNGYNFSDLNTLMDDERFGNSKSYELSSERQLESLMNSSNY